MLKAIYAAGVLVAIPVLWVWFTKKWADDFDDGRATWEGVGWAVLMCLPIALFWPLGIPAFGIKRLVDSMNTPTDRRLPDVKASHD